MWDYLYWLVIIPSFAKPGDNVPIDSTKTRNFILWKFEALEEAKNLIIYNFEHFIFFLKGGNQDIAYYMHL